MKSFAQFNKINENSPLLPDEIYINDHQVRLILDELESELEPLLEIDAINYESDTELIHADGVASDHPFLVAVNSEDDEQFRGDLQVFIEIFPESKTRQIEVSIDIMSMSINKWQEFNIDTSERVPKIDFVIDYIKNYLTVLNL